MAHRKHRFLKDKPMEATPRTASQTTFCMVQAIAITNSKHHTVGGKICLGSRCLFMAQPLLQQGWQFNGLESNSIHAWKNKYDACTKEHSKRQTEDALVIIRLDATAM
jgi:hypothetical protein